MALSQANFENEVGEALAGNNERLMFDKATIATQVAGAFTSLWRATGFPAQGAVPAAAALCTKALAGAFSFTNTAGAVVAYIGWAYYIAGSVGHAYEIHDRLAHMGGLSGTVTTAQNVTLDLATLGLPAGRLGDATYNDVIWWLEWYTATGATGVNATINVTYDDASTGNIVVAVPASTGASRAIPFLPAVAGRGIKGVNNVTLSATTGTAGSFGVTATRQRTALDNEVAGKGKNFNWAMLGIPKIENDSCLFGIMPVLTTSSGTARGQMKLIKV